MPFYTPCLLSFSTARSGSLHGVHQLLTVLKDRCQLHRLQPVPGLSECRAAAMIAVPGIPTCGGCTPNPRRYSIVNDNKVHHSVVGMTLGAAPCPSHCPMSVQECNAGTRRIP
ncbi:hypothetical protein PsYK624_016030 [Phanerochaete sordida]|uniref:Uncharacterized protein n=1 Tax=Phanerochaete sordida TaxID=48140 RepID=A0A9P3L8H5_9APHY|nr:hypothetical protein PsYK624_016030 [Phanerochaete sordida]